MELNKKRLCAPVKNSSLESSQYGPWTRKIDLQAQGNVSVSIVIISLEDVCHALQAYTSLDEKIEAQALLSASIVASPSDILGIGVEQ